MRSIVLVVIFQLSLLQLCAWERPEKKLLYFGWMVPQTLDKYQQATVDMLEKDLPFDGIGVRPIFTIQRDGKNMEFSFSRTMTSNGVALQKEDLQAWVEVFKKFEFCKLRDNFMFIASSQFNKDWFDDDAWKLSLNNFKILAEFSKEVGFKGICLDTEAYPFTGRPFFFRPELNYSFEATEEKVRQRAGEWIETLGKAFPEMVLFTFIWASDCNGPYYTDSNPSDLKTISLALQRAFMNGVYDKLPETIKIVDGNEDPGGYHSAFVSDFDASVARYYLYPKHWIDKRNLAKYYTQTSLATALYLDSYIKGNKAPYDLWTKTNNNVKMLQENISHALEYADEYAWVWAEKGTFWKELYAESNYLDWNQTIPFAKEAITAGRYPMESARRYAASDNLLQNPELDGEGSSFQHWITWCRDTLPHGEFRAEDGMIKVTGMGDAALFQNYKEIAAGERYVLQARAKTVGDCQIPSLNFDFRDVKGAIVRTTKGKVLFGKTGADGFRHASIMIDVPDVAEIDCLTSVLSVTGPREVVPADSACFFDFVELKRVVYPWDALSQEGGLH